MKQVFNFCAGPAMLPREVMRKAQNDLIDWNNTGCSVMEMSHRSHEFVELANHAEQTFRRLLNIPENYRVLFMHGGGRGQFSAVPLNLLGAHHAADYAVTGSWSQAAAQEANKFCQQVNIATEIKDNDGIKSVAATQDWQISESSAYLHLCNNETVDGIKLKSIPKTSIPIVADMSSCILSEQIDITDYGLIYAGAQKNIGPSGLTIVIVREDLLGQSRPDTPSIQDYTLTAAKESMFNTPPTFAWYLAGLVFDWLEQSGGVSTISEVNQRKSALLYDAIDQSSFYRNSIHLDNRSLMNIPFQLANPALDKLFLQKAEEHGLVALAGHRSVGGMRASIYNAMPIEGVQALVDFMKLFEKENA